MSFITLWHSDRSAGGAYRRRESGYTVKAVELIELPFWRANVMVVDSPYCDFEAETLRRQNRPVRRVTGLEKLFRLAGASRYDPEVDGWLSNSPIELFALARHWFDIVRNCGDDVNELIHDGCPVGCIGDAAFAYVNVFKAHVSVGFFTGAFLDDPEKMLEGSGRRMRHVKVRPGSALNSPGLENLISAAYQDVRRRNTL